jgi:hypothetical protein
MGLDANEAASRLAELNSPEALKAREALLESQPVKDYLKKVDVDQVEGMFHSWGDVLFGTWVPGVSPPPDLGVDAEGQAIAVTEFKQLFRESLGEVGGDLDAAQELAFQRMSRNWGVSEFSPHGSNIILKHPVEKLYPALEEDGHKYVRDQAKAVLEEEGIEARRFFLVGNQYTVADRRAGRAPRLTLVYDDQNGVRQQLNTAFFADYDAALAEEAARKAADFEQNGERYLQEREDGLARKALGDSSRPSEMGGTPFQQMQQATEEFRQLEEAGQ